MISKLNDSTNRLLLDLLYSVLRIEAVTLTKMNDEEVLSIFLKLSFQHRSGCGVFEHYGSFTNERNSIDQIDRELANLELLK